MIKSIRIQNFRSLVDVTVDLDPFTVLIGRSGTGKSNFVHALRFLRDQLSDRPININYPSLRIKPKGEEGRADPAFTVRLSVAGLGDDFLYYLRLDTTSYQPVRVEEWLEAGGRKLFHHHGSKWIVEPGVTPTPRPEGILLGAIPGLLESAFVYVALQSGIGCYDFPSTVLTSARPPQQLPDVGLGDKGENHYVVAERILSDLSRAPHWKQMGKSLRAVNHRIINLTLNLPIADRIDAALRLGERLVTLDVREESEGFRRYLAHLLALYQTPSKQTLLFEHPESGFHPGALQSLAEELTDAAEEGRGQVILTTHSPQLLHYFPVKSIRVVEIDHHTRIGPLAPEQLKAVEERLLLPDELLTVDPARLEGQLNEVPG